MATDTEHRFWGENTNSCGRQWYKPGKRFISRSLPILRKWKLTVLKQKRQWNLSISSENYRCQKERCQIWLPNPILLDASVVSREGEESKRFNGNSICATSLRIKLRPCTLCHLKMYCRVYLCRTGEVKLQFQKSQIMDGSYHLLFHTTLWSLRNVSNTKLAFRCQGQFLMHIWINSSNM